MSTEVRDLEELPPEHTPCRVAIVYGAPTGGGRLATAASWARECASGFAGHDHVEYVDLSTTSVTDPEALAPVLQQFDRATAVVFVSPVYRASFPGVLKCVLDALPVSALEFKPVAIIAMGASMHHYLAVDRHLRDVLGWFGALVAPTSVYLTGSAFGEHGNMDDGSKRDIALLVEGIVGLSRARFVAPEPLAARATK
jgi:FMN reductase